MVRQTKTLQFIARWVGLMVIAGIFTASGCLAAESGNAAGAIRKITPMGEMGTHSANIQAEDYYDIVGILNLLESDRIIVGNNELKPASGLKSAQVELSNTVGVNLNGSGEVVSIETIYDDPH